MTAPHESADVLDTPEAGALVVRGGALRVAGFVLGTLLSLAGVVAVTRHLGVVEYGRYQSVTALVAVLAALGDGGLGTLALREYAQTPPPDRGPLLEGLLGLRIVLMAVGVPVSALAALALGYDATMVAGAVIAAGAMLLLAVQQTAIVPLQSQLRIGTITALELARQATTTALMVGLVSAGAGLLPFLSVPLPVAVALVVLTAVAVGGLPRPRMDREAWPRLLRAGTIVGLATASGVLYLYTSLLVCELVASPAETGFFSASFRVIILVAAVPALLATSAFPLLSRAATTARERYGRVVSGLLEGSVLLGAAAALGAILGAPAIIAVIAGDGFAPAITPLRIQGTALVLTFAISALGFALLAQRRHRALVTGNVVAFATTAVAVAILAAADGERGAALGAALGEVVLCTAYAVAVSADVQLRPARLPRIFVAMAGGLTAGALLPVPAVPATAAGLAVYGALAVLLGAVPPDVRTLLRPTMGRR